MKASTDSSSSGGSGSSIPPEDLLPEFEFDEPTLNGSGEKTAYKLVYLRTPKYTPHWIYYAQLERMTTLVFFFSVYFIIIQAAAFSLHTHDRLSQQTTILFLGLRVPRRKEKCWPGYATVLRPPFCLMLLTLSQKSTHTYQFSSTVHFLLFLMLCSSHLFSVVQLFTPISWPCSFHLCGQNIQ